MKQNIRILTIVMLGVGLCFSACARHPLTDSEFRGFCYTTIDRVRSCDTIDICNTFDSDAISKKEPSRQACINDCDAVYNRLYDSNLYVGCTPMLRSANDWCYKYCMDNYPN